MQSMELLLKLRREAMKRCAERIKSKGTKNHICPDSGLTTPTKAKHGL